MEKYQIIGSFSTIIDETNYLTWANQIKAFRLDKINDILISMTFLNQNQIGQRECSQFIDRLEN